jgi:hypothetical protein
MYLLHEGVSYWRNSLGCSDVAGQHMRALACNVVDDDGLFFAASDSRETIAGQVQVGSLVAFVASASATCK